MTAAELTGAQPDNQQEQQLVAGRYRLDRRIGSGRLGDIFAAIDEDYQAFGVAQHVAVQIAPDIVVRNNTLYNKVGAGYQSLRAAAHPTIVNYRHFGRDGKVAYLVMDFLAGASLRELLDNVETLPLDEAIPVIRGVGEALRFLHARSLGHGNLTSRNVFITEKLEVRVLDVVPLNAAESIFRGAATSETSGRSIVDDDIFALACVAYEMLAGIHPFNHAPPAEALSAGLEPERIASLSDAEWDTLRRALSPGEEPGISSVADFMDGFGIKGTEHLRQTVEPPAATDPEAHPAVSQPPSAVSPVNALPQAVSPEPIPAVRAQPGRKRTRQRVSPLRAVFLGAVLAGLGAWTYYGEPDIYLADLVGYVDERMNLSIAERLVAGDRPAAQEPAPPIAREVTEPAATVGELPAGSPVEGVSEDGERSPGETTVTRSLPDESTAMAGPEGAPEESPPIVEDPIVTVSERDASARIALPQAGESLAGLVWWTSEHTADADTDFIAVQQQAADLFPGDDVLHVPLVNDSLSEPRESFFVNFGREDTLTGQVERVATVRVDIIDDDSR
jgi:hypothetical protein